jgi:putative FmdB family regulatory protein
MRDTMPIHEYRCNDCGLQIERLFKRVSAVPDAVNCPDCEDVEMQKLVSAVNHTFKHGAGQTRGMLPPNTGTSDDWNADKAIGRDAARKWETINQRKAHKDKILASERAQGRDARTEHLVRTPDGDYRMIKEPERKAVNTARSIHHEAAKQRKAADSGGAAEG